MKVYSTSIRVDPQLWRKFKAKTALKGESMTAVIEDFIKKYLEEEP